jgi:RNA polymerase-binding transcription factor DksA
MSVGTGEPADLGVLDSAEGELEDVERALRRMDEGTYGTCEACGRPIGEQRLALFPLTRRCAEHAQVVAPGASAGI